jgi:hypothetical protein
LAQLSHSWSWSIETLQSAGSSVFRTTRLGERVHRTFQPDAASRSVARRSETQRRPDVELPEKEILQDASEKEILQAASSEVRLLNGKFRALVPYLERLAANEHGGPASATATGSLQRLPKIAFDRALNAIQVDPTATQLEDEATIGDALKNLSRLLDRVQTELDDAPNPDTMEATRDTIETLEIIVRRWRNRRGALAR